MRETWACKCGGQNMKFLDSCFQCGEDKPEEKNNE